MAENIDLESVFETVRQELTRLLKERDETIRRRAEIEQQLTGLKQTITGLLHYSKGQQNSELAAKGSTAFKALLDRVDDASPALTLTDACRRAFTVYRQPLCASDLKNYLEAAGYDFESYKSNPLISIHSVLKRLQESKEIKLARTEGNTSYYSASKAGHSLAEALNSLATIDFGFASSGLKGLGPVAPLGTGLRERQPGDMPPPVKPISNIGFKKRLLRRNRGLIPAQVACQASDKGPVRVPGRCESRRIFSS